MRERTSPVAASAEAIIRPTISVPIRVICSVISLVRETSSPEVAPSVEVAASVDAVMRRTAASDVPLISATTTRAVSVSDAESAAPRSDRDAAACATC
ncbi:hypothetical protein [Jiella pelagia]|uniref:Uncharacterized protein n=1 Tax=Jiella pelagia TaxID=2986949 RepID=A0ABY7BZQ5_9HYPH|nr:hypothetical protein [Jiella pelagia]WAP68580.1 hypothetical protein OH818_25405 [Jiella pelagia]